MVVGVEHYGDGAIDVVHVHGVELGGGKVISKIPEQGGEVTTEVVKLYFSFDLVVVAGGVVKISGGAGEDGDGYAASRVSLHRALYTAMRRMWYWPASSKTMVGEL
ncbi:MAG: hypothetical protein IPK46_03905 [Saprospiraceae bacterium]|nr:hypothetical protein [Saprospiraceae bacterium]